MEADRNNSGALSELELQAELRRLRHDGLARFAAERFPLLALAAACALSVDVDAVNRRHIEQLLEAAVRQLGDGLYGEAAAVLYGIAPGSYGYKPTELRRRATELFRESSFPDDVDAFRNGDEKRIIAALAARIAVLGERPAVAGQAPAPAAAVSDQEVAVDVSYTDLLTQLRLSPSLEACLSAASSFIRDEIFPATRVRVGYVEKAEENGISLLRPRFLIAAAATGNSFAYPVTFAAWSLATGEIVAYPRDLPLPCDFKRLAKLGKLDDVMAAARAIWTAPEQPLFKYLDRAALRDRFEEHETRLGDFYQDWETDQRTRRYVQFLSVPVPIVRRSATDKKPPEYGVFNIDTMSEEPMLTPRSEAQLEFLCEALYLAFERLYPANRADGSATDGNQSADD